MVPETVSRWLVKNMKKLESGMDKARNELRVIWDEFAEKSSDGKMLYWDGTNAENVAIADKEGNLVLLTGEKVTQEGKFFPYVKKENQETYNAKNEELRAKIQEVYLLEINNDLISNLNIPLQKTNPPKPMNMVLFYEALVIDEDKEAKETEPEISKNGKMEVVS